MLKEKVRIAVWGNTVYDSLKTTSSFTCSLTKLSGDYLFISKFVDFNILKDVLLFYKAFCYKFILLNP